MKKNCESKIMLYGALGVLIVSISGFSQDIYSETSMKSKFIAENLHGDTIDTMRTWHILPDDSLDVNLINGNLLTDYQYKSVVNVITSMYSIELYDNLQNKEEQNSLSTYYFGWAGAMLEAKKNKTAHTIPANYNIIQSSNGEGHIVILFSNQEDVDGLSGYTRTILTEDEIIKSIITIYDVKNLKAYELATIIRHEFGHALGLGHSTDPEDLMSHAIQTDFPYISECNLDAIIELYNGNESSSVTCKK